MTGSAKKSAPKQLINEVPSHVVLVNNKVGARQVRQMQQVLKASRTDTETLTTLYFARSREWSIMNMQNCLVHYLISTKLCTTVQNYIVTLDLHVHCQIQKYYV